jgi:galactokinase/mevalonate kinase-like predicted kinase
VTRAVEATAPLRVDLAGGLPEPLAASLGIAGPVAVSVAVDRRAWCRVEAGGDGVRIESKDTLQRLAAASVGELVAAGRGGVAARVLQALGIDSGVAVVTQARVPGRLGLGGSSALAVATTAAAARAFGIALEPQRLLALAREAEDAAGGAGPRQAYETARLGGIVGLEAQAGGTWRAGRLRVDPGRVEECLLLLETGTPDGETAAGAGASAPGERDAALAIAARAAAASDALACGRYAALAGGFEGETQARRRLGTAGWSARSEELAALVREAGGDARPCASGAGGVLAVWAPPGERGPGARESVLSRARGAGLRPFAARVDLIGLDVEETA